MNFFAKKLVIDLKIKLFMWIFCLRCDFKPHEETWCLFNWLTVKKSFLNCLFFSWGYTTVYFVPGLCCCCCFMSKSSVECNFFFLCVSYEAKSQFVLKICLPVSLIPHTRPGDVICDIISDGSTVFTSHTLFHTHTKACAGLMYGTNKKPNTLP